MAGQGQGAVLAPAILDQGLTRHGVNRNHVDKPARRAFERARELALHQGFAGGRDNADEPIVADVKLCRHLQLDRHGVFGQLGQRQGQRGSVVDVLHLQLLLQVMSRRQNAHDHAAAKGERHDQCDGNPELFDKGHGELAG